MSKLASGIVAVGKSYNADPLRITTREGWNNRFDLGDIETLATGIASTLAKTPDRPYGTDMEVKRIPKSDPRSENFDFEVVTGHRRHAATQVLLARGTQFPEGVNIHLLDRDTTDLDNTIRLFVENNQKPLLPLEEAAAYARLKEGGLTIAEICKAVGRTDVHVRETLALLEADEDLQEAVKRGEVSGSTAKTIAAVSKGDKAAQKELTAAAKQTKQAKGKDAKAAKAALDAKIAAKRAANAQQAGREVKARPLNADQLSKLGEKIAKHLETVSKEAKFAELLADQVKYREMVSKDEALAAAYMLGAFQALQAAAGVDVDLMI